MTVIAIKRVDFPKGDLQSGLLVRVLIGRFDNTTVQLIGFPGGQFVRPRSGS